MSDFRRPKKPNMSQPLDTTNVQEGSSHKQEQTAGSTAPVLQPPSTSSSQAAQHDSALDQHSQYRIPVPRAHRRSASSQSPDNNPGKENRRLKETISELEEDKSILENSREELTQKYIQDLKTATDAQAKAEASLQDYENAYKQLEEEVAKSKTREHSKSEIASLSDKHIESLEKQILQDKNDNEQQSRQIVVLKREIDKRKYDAEKVSDAVLKCAGERSYDDEAAEAVILTASEVAEVWERALQRIDDDKSAQLAVYKEEASELKRTHQTLQYTLKKSMGLMKQGGVDASPLFHGHEGLLNLARGLDLVDSDAEPKEKTTKSRRRRQKRRALRMEAKAGEDEAEGPTTLADELAEVADEAEPMPQTIVEEEPKPRLAIAAPKTIFEVEPLEPTRPAAPTYAEAACQASISDYSGDDEVVTFGTSPPTTDKAGSEGNLFPDLIVAPAIAINAVDSATQTPSPPATTTTAVTAATQMPALAAPSAVQGSSRYIFANILSILLKIFLFAAAVYFLVGGYQAKRERELWRDANEPARVLLVEKMGWVHHAVNPFLREKFMGMDAWGGATQVEF